MSTTDKDLDFFDGFAEFDVVPEERLVELRDALVRERIRARRILTLTAKAVFAQGGSPDNFYEIAPEWAFELVPHEEIKHLIAYVWGSR